MRLNYQVNYDASQSIDKVKVIGRSWYNIIANIFSSFTF